MKNVYTWYCFALVLGVILASTAIAQDCFETSVVSPVPFMGNNEEIFKLADGSLWEVKYEYEYLYEYYPSVIVCPGRGKLIINEKALDIVKLSPPGSNPNTSPSDYFESGQWKLFEETNLVGSISGTVMQGKIFKTASGSIYEVTGLTLQLVLELSPNVIVLSNGNLYKLVVDGFDEPLICRKIK